MVASNEIEAIGTMLRIQSKNKTAKKRKFSYLYHLIGSYLSVQVELLRIKLLVELEFYKLINCNHETIIQFVLQFHVQCRSSYVFKLLLTLFRNITHINHFIRLFAVYLFSQHVSFKCFPLASTNDVNKLVSSINSALSHLVGKLQNFCASPNVT